ncbi:hypothetical protein HRR83_007282 [Exophiala dermatitidis]|uniref:GPI anchored serine-threonine rich protein n=2 Tax=Exophiala dermatitidis TaxID=5970 RepID=H6C3Y6_EXODN|nr:uncharacterized protein HMPREF1120_06363 [Exophiala dermatitidis NIH/UT8656]KAJ4511240.1 hypothetical protein HRR73_006573 [Exophiala dermatitidis]EHY58351.1 hypothetical protein HMPREF1120_06363 [Exophiala dermatitidis NIH/UT8656]KAJ4511824.1 hypothetical protein HRR74_006558 [Exophiala dermatitidis]KAJ4534680.1 hypothetical protein HRR76_006594 [Exophiala dermatitidis]KAJ4550969.1 hypothetical protein HRR77_003321 [Exophiala dermatitidis]
MRFIFAFAVLPIIVSASVWPDSGLLARATTGNDTISCISDDDKVCGKFCIPSDYTCCPDNEGGCSSSAVCQKGENGVYGCCPKGETCQGDGGAEFIDEDGDSSSSSDTATKTGNSTSGAGPIVFRIHDHGITFAAAVAAFAAGLVVLV